MKKEELSTKEKILQATLELAAKEGLGSVSLAQIAKKVGIQKPSLYNHFASKDEIILGLYQYLRQKAKEKMGVGMIDYGELVKGKSAMEVLSMAVSSYDTMNSDEDMTQFYRFIMSERCFRKEAAAIMLAETEKMILATKHLFYAMQAQHVMTFENVDMAAFSFAMAVHSIMDYQHDQEFAGTGQTATQLLEEYLRDFCQVYERGSSNEK